ncbi:MAG TPA: tetratricopeptide repeat protein, partial [bacterium]|nr:tetratricopeptide repeat protein [bacterium]
MNRHRFFSVIALCLAHFLLFRSPAQAYTAADYYNAGLQLYNAQNYAQAVQYFSAAIQTDPNNTAALQGRANCYYAQGQYQQALDDYQKVQAISPNPQLASLIQSLQAKVGTSTAAAPPPAPGATAEDSFAQGTALFQQRQYAQAIPLFQKAAQDNPKNANAYYYLGACQMQTGDLKDAAVALGISNKINPNPSVGNYVNQLKSRLSPDDQQWVDGQIASANTSGAASKTAATPKTFGIRLEPSLAFISLADFTTNAQSWSNEAVTAQQNGDSSIGYSGTVPSGSPDIAIEGVWNLTPNLQVGLPIAILPVGNASDNLQDNNGVTIKDSYNITAVAFGPDLRYFFGAGEMQPYICAGAVIAPINIVYSASATLQPNPFYPPYTASGNFTGTAAGGQISAGLDWHLGDTFVVSPFAGFQFVSGNSFQATVNNSSGSGSSGQTAQLEVIPTSVGNVITPVSNGKLMYWVLNGSQQP